LVFRVQLSQQGAPETSAHKQQEGVIAELVKMVTCASRPPLFYNNARGAQLESRIQAALWSQRKQVAPQVRALGAAEFCEAMRRDGWSRKLSSQVVTLARKSMSRGAPGPSWMA